MLGVASQVGVLSWPAQSPLAALHSLTGYQRCPPSSHHETLHLGKVEGSNTAAPVSPSTYSPCWRCWCWPEQSLRTIMAGVDSKGRTVEWTVWGRSYQVLQYTHITTHCNQTISGEPKQDYPIYGQSFLCKLNPKNPGCPGWGKWRIILIEHSK